MGDNRRTFLRRVITAGAAGLTAPASSHASLHETVTPTGSQRSQAALEMREQCARLQCTQPTPAQISNGDETSLAGYVGNFTKGLPHDQQGLVDPTIYDKLLYALSTGKSADFEAVGGGSGMKLIDPQSAFAYEMEGADSHQLTCPPAPTLASAQSAAEMVELYWQALARDVPFTDYTTSPVIQAAAQEIGKLSAFQGPTQNGAVTPAIAFRGPFNGCLTGPYISQFLWQPVPTLSTWVDQRYRVPSAGADFLTSYSEWVVLQSGLPPYRTCPFDPTARYISNGRGLAEWVHYDFLYQAFHNAALILLNQGPESILNTNPYYNPTNPYKKSRVQTGFVTFGAPHICGWLGRVTTSALEAAWYQKWAVHRRLRPEEYGGLVHESLAPQTGTGGARAYSLSKELLNSTAVAQVFAANQTYLLPQAFPEGCPLHPAYPAGHATVAGACSALLKAFFDENGLVTDAVVANSDGTKLLPYTDTALTVGGEINKLAFNVAIGRNFAGIHYRSDAMAGFALGEEVAIAKMQDLVNTFSEDFAGFQFTRLDGTAVQIVKQTGPGRRAGDST
jgi:hypothetical protein